MRLINNMPTVLAVEPFSPVLLSEPGYPTPDERMSLIRRAIDVASSDSQFANKLYDAIQLILSSPAVAFPKLSSISPTEIETNNGPFSLTAMGSQFTPTSVIYMAGKPLATTFVSETELSANPTITGITAPAQIPVAVVDKGVMSDILNLSLIQGV